MDLRLRIDVVPLANLDVVHGTHKKETSVLGDLDDGEVRGRAGAQGWI